MTEFNCLEDIYEELSCLYDEAQDKGFQLGEALYTQISFFADINRFITEKIQNRIKEYLFCKNFNTPMYSSMQETPAEIIDDFTIIDQEYIACIKHNKDKKD